MLSVFLNSALAARTQTPETYWAMWQDFQKSGDRWMPEILHADEHNKRFEIFQDNVDKITEHNAKGLSWTLGVTPFADMTPKEFKDMVVTDQCKDSFQKDAKLIKAKNKLLQGRRRAIVDNPSSVDWDTAGKVTNVKNQGSCGSCWSFSTTGGIESRTAIANNASPVSLSEQELVDCDTNDHGCNGGSMVYGIMYSEEHDGLCTESEYPYKAVAGTCMSSGCDHVSPTTGYEIVYGGESALETAVAAGPVSIAIEADQMAFQLYTGGVFSGSCGTALDHGVLVVGYGTDAGQKYWKVKNSWGASWGESGYIRMCKECGKNGSDGECGIADLPVYPKI